MSKKVNPWLAFAINALLGQKKEEQGDVPELGEVPAILTLRKKEGAVVVILGRRESGKTILSQRLAEVIGRPTYAVSPEQTPPQWIKELRLEELSEKPPPYSTLVLDDLPAYMGSRDYQDAFVQQVEKLIPVCRHRRKLILVFSSQTSGQADKWCMDADLILMKSMGWLYPEIERPTVKKLADKVMPTFRQMSDLQQKKHCYIFSDGYVGMARIDLPKGIP